MSVMNRNMPLATSAIAPPSLLTQVGMAGTAAVITVRTSYNYGRPFTTEMKRLSVSDSFSLSDFLQIFL